MIKVYMSEDIRKIEPKYFWIFTKRQFYAVVIGAVFALPFSILIPVASFLTRIIIFIFCCLPIASCGWVKMNGVYLEVLAIRIVYKYILTPPRRKNRESNFYRRELNVIKKEKENEMIRRMAPKDRKNYLKNKKNHKVTYSKKKSLTVYR